MNFLKLVLAGFYRISQKAYEEYKIEKVKNNKYIELSPSAKIFSSASLDALNEKSIIIGNNTGIRGRIVTFPGGGRVIIGDDSYVGMNTQIWSEDEVKIGNRVLIAHNCNIFDSSTHPIDKEERHDQFCKIMSSGFPVKGYKSLKKSKIEICDDAWICADCTILKGVHIGEGSIIAAGSVVTQDIPDNVIVAGNPAKVIKYLVKDKENAKC